MSLLETATTGKEKGPSLIAIYSQSGIGKTTFAATAPKVIFADFENSSKSINTTRVHLTNWDKTYQFLVEIRDDKHDFENLALDTLDKLETYIHEQVAKDEGKKSIDDIGYNKGYIYALSYWDKLIKILNEIRFDRGMNVILLSHANIKRFNDPYLNEGYDRFEMKLHHKAADLIKESVEMLLFARKDTVIKEERSGKKKAIDVDDRVLHTQLEAAFDAKNRVGLPAKFLMDETKGFAVLTELIEKSSGETAEDLLKQCTEAIKRVDDKDTRKQMTDFINGHKADTNVLRLTLDKIIAKTKEH